MKVVVDTSSFFYGFLPDSKNDYYTTESVLSEIRGRRMKQSIDLRSEFLRVMNPKEEFLYIVKEKAKETGDDSQLSPTDIDVIALAIQISATILTNDLAIQNTSRALGLKYESFKSKNIRNIVKWKYKCEGCGRIYDEYIEECPHCGNKLKKFPAYQRIIR